MWSSKDMVCRMPSCTCIQLGSWEPRASEHGSQPQTRAALAIDCNRSCLQLGTGLAARAELPPSLVPATGQARPLAACIELSVWLAAGRQQLSRSANVESLTKLYLRPLLHMQPATTWPCGRNKCANSLALSHRRGRAFPAADCCWHEWQPPPPDRPIVQA
jgi:hypothetical protein